MREYPDYIHSYDPRSPDYCPCFMDCEDCGEENDRNATSECEACGAQLETPETECQEPEPYDGHY